MLIFGGVKTFNHFPILGTVCRGWAWASKRRPGRLRAAASFSPMGRDGLGRFFFWRWKTWQPGKLPKNEDPTLTCLERHQREKVWNVPFWNALCFVWTHWGLGTIAGWKLLGRSRHSSLEPGNPVQMAMEKWVPPIFIMMDADLQQKIVGGSWKGKSRSEVDIYLCIYIYILAGFLFTCMYILMYIYICIYMDLILDGCFWGWSPTQDASHPHDFMSFWPLVGSLVW